MTRAREATAAVATTESTSDLPVVTPEQVGKAYIKGLGAVDLTLLPAKARQDMLGYAVTGATVLGEVTLGCVAEAMVEKYIFGRENPIGARVLDAMFGWLFR